MPKLAGPEKFPAVIDSLGDELRAAGFIAEADHLYYLTHEFVYTTSNELYGELSVELRTIQREPADLPDNLAAKVNRLIKSINRICRWR